MTDIRLSARPTLMGAVWPEQASTGARAMRAVLLAMIGSGLLALAARISVPFIPVPLTLQTLVVLLLGAVLGARLAAGTALLYLAEGAAGLPVFAGTPEHGIGLAYMMGPTGGYLVGYVIAMGLIGWFAERGADRSAARLGAAMLAGQVVIFGLGFAWLAHLIGAPSAFKFGVLPFIAGDLVKTLLAALLVPAVWRMMVKIR